MSEAAIAEPKTQCLACGNFQNVEPATLCEHCLAKATVLLKQGHTPAQIALGREDIRAVLEGWQESREKSIMSKTTNKTNKAVSRETPEPVLPVAESDNIARSIAILIPIDAIEANPYQPRKIFTEKEMQELVDSIREHGVLQPILVRPNPADETRYQLIAGERRWRASQEAGLVEIEAVVRTVGDQVMAEMAIIENAQRQDISVIEQAVAIKRLMTDFNVTADYVAQRTGISRPVVSNRVRLLELPPEVQDRITVGELSESHGRALIKYKRFPDFISFYAGHIVEKQLTSKLVESGLHFQMGWQECSEFADDLEERGLLLSLDSDDYTFVKEEDLLFEHPEAIFKGSLEEDEKCLLCLDVDLARSLNEQWELRDKEERKAAAKNQSAASIGSTSNETSAEELKEREEQLAIALAKAKAGEVIFFSDLHYSQYTTIYSHNCPSTCNAQCECRAQAKHNDSSTHVTDICLNPGRLKKLQDEAANATKKARHEKAKNLSDKIFPALDEFAEMSFIGGRLEALALPVLVLAAIRLIGTEDLMKAAERLDLEFDAEKFGNRDTDTSKQLDILFDIPDLTRFAIEVFLRNELNKVAEYDWAKGDCTKWLIGVLEADDGN